MSLALLITINVLAAVALIAGLAQAMSRTTLLKPHVASPGVTGQAASAEPARAAARPRRSTWSSRPAGARQPATMSNHVGSHTPAAQES